MFLAAAVPKGIKFDKNEVFYGKPVSEASIQTVWDEAIKRERVPAEFIGCGKPDEGTVVAVLRMADPHYDVQPVHSQIQSGVLEGRCTGVRRPKFYQEMMVVAAEREDCRSGDADARFPSKTCKPTI